ncbi:MAG: protein kinase domain-containing protein [Myxococcota bacterium]
METPQHIGKYEILGRLGAGGMAEVFLARRTGAAGFEKKVAIKRISAQKAEDEMLIRGLINEARLVSQLSHQNLVQVLEFELIDRSYCLAMEFIDGMTLETVMDRAAAAGIYLPAGLVSYIAMEVCAGLDYAHTARNDLGEPLQLVHRDIKPSNIMISRQGQVKLMDFGIARASTNAYKTTQHGSVKGTLSYMSPEQLSGEPDLKPASDLYSFGLVLYELATLQRLYDDSNLFKLAASMQTGLAGPARERLSACFPELVPIVSRLLDFYPEKRYPDARALMYELRPLKFHASALELSEFLQELTQGGPRGREVKTLASVPQFKPVRASGIQAAQPSFVLEGEGIERGSTIELPSAALNPLTGDAAAVAASLRGDAQTPPGSAAGAFEKVRASAVPAGAARLNGRPAGSDEAASAAKVSGAEAAPAQRPESDVSALRSIEPPAPVRGGASDAQDVRSTGYTRRHLVASAAGGVLTGVGLVGIVVAAGVIWLLTSGAEEQASSSDTTPSAAALMTPAVGENAGAEAKTSVSPEVAVAQAPAMAEVGAQTVSTVVDSAPTAAPVKLEPARQESPKKPAGNKSSARPREAAVATRAVEVSPAPAEPAKPEVSPGTVFINSDPWSEITLNGQQYDAPYRGKLPAGRYAVKLKASSGEEYAFTLEVPSGGSVKKVWSFKEKQWLGQ